GIDRRALRCGGSKAPIGMRGGTLLVSHLVLREPWVAAPVDELRGGGVRHALPPDATVGFAVFTDGEGDVGEDGVLLQCRHGVGIGLRRSTRRNAEEAC